MDEKVGGRKKKKNRKATINVRGDTHRGCDKRGAEWQ